MRLFQHPFVTLTQADALCLMLFVIAERHAKQLITPLRLFANRRRSAALAARFLYLGAMVGFWFFSSLLLAVGLRLAQPNLLT